MATITADTFHHLSDWQQATITHRTPSGAVIVATVIETAVDEHGVWLYVSYMAFNRDGRTMPMTAWLAQDDCKWISAGQQTATTEVIAAHL